MASDYGISDLVRLQIIEMYHHATDLSSIYNSKIPDGPHYIRHKELEAQWNDLIECCFGMYWYLIIVRGFAPYIPPILPILLKKPIRCIYYV
jgi:hypothetical protein